MIFYTKCFISWIHPDDIKNLFLYWFVSDYFMKYKKCKKFVIIHLLDFLILWYKQSKKQQKQKKNCNLSFWNNFEIIFEKWPFFEQFLKYSIYWLNLYDHVIVNIGLNITQWWQFKLKVHINTKKKLFLIFFNFIVKNWPKMLKSQFIVTF